MKREEYRSLKMRSKEGVLHLRDICTDCLKSKKTCYCGLIKPFQTEFELVILIHPKESRNSVGTGRMTHLCISNSKLIEGIDFSDSEEVNDIINDKESNCLVLYPSKKSINIDELSKTESEKLYPKNKKTVIFAIDGTWSLAKKMMKLSTNLNKLPRISFTPTERSKYSIRVEPNPVCLSTIESIYRVISILDSKEIYKVKPKRTHTILMDLFLNMVKQQVDFEKTQSGTYRPFKRRLPEEIQPAKKWEKRSLFFNK